MSRKDLDQIQAHLKVAIQNHQHLVAKMKHDPQNGGLQRQLHDLQSQITNLSEKQKSIVQQLRKELVSKQPVSVATDLSQVKNRNSSSEQQPASKPNASPSTQKPNVLTSVNNNISKTTAQSGRSRPKSQPGSRSGSPLIRVPHFTSNRPQLLQGGENHSVSHLQAGPKGSLRSQACSSPSAASNRKNSDSDVNSYFKKSSFDRKELPPEERKKLEYMASLDLITPETLKELQTRRSERKRRSTANPQFSYGHFEPTERKRRVVNYLAAIAPVQGVRRRGRPPKNPTAHYAALGRGTGGAPSQARRNAPKIAVVRGVPQTQRQTSQESAQNPDSLENDIHEDFCAECHRSGELLMCDTCSLVYHLSCLDPPLTAIPQGLWSCPKCKALGNKTGDNNNLPGTLALVHSYITHKAAKEEDKKRLQHKVQDLTSEKAELDKKAKTLSETIKKQIQQKAELLNNNRSAQQSVDQLKNFISVFQS